MGKIYQCVGHYAETAYTIKRTWIHIYCVEELCYYICNNAYLLEEDFISQDLLLWLEADCMLPALAKTLRAQIRQGAGLAEQIRLLLESVHYCPQKEIDEIIGMIAANDSMNALQKNKIRADYFLKNERLVLALQCYEDLQDELAETGDDKLTASVLYNMGVIYAHLFLFRQAGECFQQAYEKHEKQEYRIAYLAAVRMIMTDTEYINLAGQHEEARQSFKVFENMLDRVNKEWKNSDEYRKQRRLEQLRESGNYEAFLKQLEQAGNVFKESYRNMILE